MNPLGAARPPIHWAKFKMNITYSQISEFLGRAIACKRVVFGPLRASKYSIEDLLDDILSCEVRDEDELVDIRKLKEEMKKWRK